MQNDVTFKDKSILKYVFKSLWSNYLSLTDLVLLPSHKISKRKLLNYPSSENKADLIN